MNQAREGILSQLTTTRPNNSSGVMSGLFWPWTMGWPWKTEEHTAVHIGIDSSGIKLRNTEGKKKGGNEKGFFCVCDDYSSSRCHLSFILVFTLTPVWTYVYHYNCSLEDFKTTFHESVIGGGSCVQGYVSVQRCWSYSVGFEFQSLASSLVFVVWMGIIEGWLLWRERIGAARVYLYFLYPSR